MIYNIFKSTFAPSLVAMLIMLLLPINTVSAARLYFFPQSVDVFQGETVFIDIRLDTEGDSINVAEIEGLLSSDNISLESVNSVNNIFPIFIENNRIDNQSFRFVAGVPGGFTGNNIVGNIAIRGVRVGSSFISFSETSTRVIENVQGGALIKPSFSNATVNVIKKGVSYIEVSSRTHPNQGSWYTNNSVNIHWDLEDGTEYSYIVTQNPAEDPDDIKDTPSGDLLFQGDISLDNLADGIYYFVIKKVGGIDTSRFRFLIDTENPEWVNIVISDGIPETDGKAFISFLAMDSLSGISYYEVGVDRNEFEKVESPYFLPDSYSKITLLAYDKAGNVVEETRRFDEPLSVKFIYTISLLVIIGFVGFFGKRFALKRKFKT